MSQKRKEIHQCFSIINKPILQFSRIIIKQINCDQTHQTYENNNNKEK